MDEPEMIPARDVTKVITVRLPRWMRDALRRRAMELSVERGEAVSLNTLCVETLAKLLPAEETEYVGQGDGEETREELRDGG